MSVTGVQLQSRSHRDEETISLLTEAATSAASRQAALREQAIRLNMPLARALANRYAGRGIPTDDLHQVAYLGLVKAVRGYDPGRGREFLRYAVPTIKGEIRRHFRDAGWTVRPPRRIQELQARLWAADAELMQSLQRSPTTDELAEELGVSAEDVIEALTVDGCFAPSSLDTPGSDVDASSLVDRLGGLDPEFDRCETRLTLADAVCNLEERERAIVRLRYVEGWTQQRIGEAIGVSQMHVSRLITRILGDLRQQVTDQVA